MKNVICYIVILITFLLVVIFFLSMKICILRKAAKEICASFHNKLFEQTNTCIDISSRDKYMRKLADSLNMELSSLYKLRHHFQQGNIELKEALTNISHDLRTPLTAVSGYLDLLKSDASPESAAKYLMRMENRTMVMKQLTEQLFQYTLLLSEESTNVLEEAALNSILEDSILAYYEELNSRHIVPRISIPEKKVMHMLNVNATARVFENILSNAVKYSDGDLDITLAEIGTITFSNHASQLTQLEVAKLFDRFYTVHNARQSTGLGLSISKLLMEQMEGRISASYDNGVLTICVKFRRCS